MMGEVIRKPVYSPPSKADLRYQWVEVRLVALDLDEMRELVTDAWRMCVPQSVARAHLGH